MSQNYQLFVDEGESQHETSPILKKRPSNIPPNVFWKILSFFTWPRLKILFILTLLVFAIYMFGSEAPEPENVLDLRATSASDPLIYELKAPKFSAPLKVLEIKIRIQEIDQSITGNITVTVTLYKNELVDGVNSRVAQPDPYSLNASHLLEVTGKSKWSIEEQSGGPYNSYYFNVSTNSQNALGLTFEAYHLPSIVKYQVIFAALILLWVYFLIIFELVHRTIAAMFGAFIALALVSKIHQRPSLGEVIGWIDFETCGLLFGMMVMVGIFSQTGFFEWSAVRAYKLSKGNIWKLVSILSIFTALISAFLDNVTTVLLLTPVTIRLCQVLEINPIQILLALVMYSNLGGTGTPVGDPPNIIIVNDAKIAASGQVNFGNFTLHMFPGVLMASAAIYFLIKKLTLPSLRRQPNMNQRQELEIWKKTANKMRAETEEEEAVKKRLEEYISILEKQIREAPTIVADIDISELEEKYKIHDFPLFINSCVILSVVIGLFFLHTPIHVELTLAWIAIIGAIAHLLSSGIHDIEEVLEKVEFGTLMFFASLFVLMQALDELGLIEFIGEETAVLIEGVPEGNARLIAAICVLLWVSAFVSAFIDNIPFTAAMVPVVYRLSFSGLPLAPLIWSLAFGTCFGGNGTLIGASANVIVAGLAEAQGYPIRFLTFLRTGLPVMIISVFVANIYLLIFHVAIPWY